jgi:hypothetical protein
MAQKVVPQGLVQGIVVLPGMVKVCSHEGVELTLLVGPFGLDREMVVGPVVMMVFQGAGTKKSVQVLCNGGHRQKDEEMRGNKG